MRCLTLANALKAQGRECHFICREHPGHLIDFIRREGYSVHPLAFSPNAETDNGLDHAIWLGATQAWDAKDCARILARLRPHWLVVDHYSLDARWEEPLKPYYQKLLVIDDLAAPLSGRLDGFVDFFSVCHTGGDYQWFAGTRDVLN
jgi:UDP-2,4-diacetamido-2,4,6-trideoxy-beta-L-altropyranose hydrolase